ncbi:uncharacterized protein LOC119649090 [Hermetia illucens]|uniref:uncharacterized protein LOC119649090 n=1 Tax=Hermetia illucens TaxID=343691 RepID=UPI0018CC0F8D|nr:uncharacterized protein LOC119649090 [Hermetia illucens]
MMVTTAHTKQTSPAPLPLPSGTQPEAFPSLNEARKRQPAGAAKQPTLRQQQPRPSAAVPSKKKVNTKMELMILQLINLLFWMRTEGGLMVEEIKTDIGYTEIKLDDIQLVQTQQTILHRINLKYIQETLIEIKNSPITNYTIDQRTYLSQEIQNLEQQYLTLLPGQYIHQHIY